MLPESRRDVISISVEDSDENEANEPLCIPQDRLEDLEFFPNFSDDSISLSELLPSQEHKPICWDGFSSKKGNSRSFLNDSKTMKKPMFSKPGNHYGEHKSICLDGFSFKEDTMKNPFFLKPENHYDEHKSICLDGFACQEDSNSRFPNDSKAMKKPMFPKHNSFCLDGFSIKKDSSSCFSSNNSNTMNQSLFMKPGNPYKETQKSIYFDRFSEEDSYSCFSNDRKTINKNLNTPCFQKLESEEKGKRVLFNGDCAMEIDKKQEHEDASFAHITNKKPMGNILRRKDNKLRCTHCQAEKTPQWRMGPLGPKTLCNACGVRFKSGRLVPEYRPAASPSFDSTKYSNFHKKILQKRRGSV